MSLPAAVSNLSAFVGQNVPINDTIYQANGSSPQNITGWSLKFTVYVYQDPGTVFFSLNTGAGNGLTITDGLNGVVQVSGAAFAGNTAAMKTDCYGFSFERTDAYAVPTIGLLTLLAAPNP